MSWGVGTAWALREGKLPWANHPVSPHIHRGLFKTDRVLGTAQLKLDALETACEVREILEVRGDINLMFHYGHVTH